jgi:hypothetical protein
VNRSADAAGTEVVVKMRRASISLILLVALSGCVNWSQVPESEVKLHYETEVFARKMEPQNGAAMLYIFPIGDSHVTHSIRINGSLQVSAYETILDEKYFYLFCLAPGEYQVEYGNIKEYLKVTANDVILREMKVDDNLLTFLSFDNKMTMRNIDKSTAKVMLDSRRLGPTISTPVHFNIYKNSSYRCRLR